MKVMKLILLDKVCYFPFLSSQELISVLRNVSTKDSDDQVSKAPKDSKRSQKSVY